MSTRNPYHENFCKGILTIIFSVIFLIILPLILIVISPLFFYRWIASCFLSKIFRPDLEKILSAHSTFYTITTSGTPEAPNTPPWANILLNMRIQGKLNLDAMVSKLVSVGYAAKSNGNLEYSQFHQYSVRWGGFLFWKFEDGDQKVKVKNHFTNHKIPQGADPEAYVANFSKEFLSTPFSEKLSPWQVVFLEYVPQEKYPDCFSDLTEGKDPECESKEQGKDSDCGSYQSQSQGEELGWYIVLFKFHHSLSDGCSIFNVMMKCVDTPVKMTLPRKLKSEGCCRKVTSFLGAPFKAAHDFAQVSYEGMNLNISPWTKDTNQLSDTRSFAETKVISIQRLKSAGDAIGVSVSAVVLAALSGGIGNFLKKQGIPPDAMMCQMPVPIPNHPDGLTNSFSLVSLKLPVGEKGLNERLRLAEDTIISAKSSLYSATVFILGKIFGALPLCLLERMPPKVQPLQLSIFPGPRSLMTFQGQPVLAMNYTVYAAKYIPVVITLLSYNDGIQIILNVDNNLFPPEKNDLHNLVKEIEAEFESSCQNMLQVISH